MRNLSTFFLSLYKICERKMFLLLGIIYKSVVVFFLSFFFFFIFSCIFLSIFIFQYFLIFFGLPSFFVYFFGMAAMPFLCRDPFLHQNYHTIELWARPFNCKFHIFLFIKKQIFICINGNLRRLHRSKFFYKKYERELG